MGSFHLVRLSNSNSAGNPWGGLLGLSSELTPRKQIQHCNSLLRKKHRPNQKPLVLAHLTFQSQSKQYSTNQPNPNQKLKLEQVHQLIKTINPSQHPRLTTQTLQSINELIPLEAPILVQLWKSFINLKRPPIDWIEWLFNATISQSTQITSNHDRVQFNRFLSIALGLMLRSLRSYQPLSPMELEEHNSKLLNWLSKVKLWQESTQSLESNELNHRRIQMNHLLSKTTKKPFVKDDHHYHHQEKQERLTQLLNKMKSSSDPYLISTLLRNETEDDLKTILENLNPTDGNSHTRTEQEELIKSIRVICRSKGKLIYQTSPTGGPHDVLSDHQVKKMLLNYPIPSLWRTGLILSFAESLVGQIDMLLNENPSSSSLCKTQIDQIMQKLMDLLQLKLSETDVTLHGGKLEKLRLLRRQTDGIEIFLQHMLLNFNANNNHEEDDDSKETLIPDFSLIFDLIETSLSQIGYHSIRTRTWKSIISSHLKFSSKWDGSDGLCRCLNLIIKWSLDFNDQQQTCSFLDLYDEPAGGIKFKKILPGDLGLLLIERVLFPQINLNLNYYDTSSIFSNIKTENSFKRLIKRIDKMKEFIQILGNPRRFRDKRLMRLIFLSVRKKQLDLDNHHHHHHHLSSEEEGIFEQGHEQQQVFFNNETQKIIYSDHHQDVVSPINDLKNYYYSPLDWWNRGSIWRDLELNLNPPPNNNPIHHKKINHHHSCVDIHQPQIEEKLENLNPFHLHHVNQPQIQFDWTQNLAFDFCNNNHHHQVISSNISSSILKNDDVSSNNNNNNNHETKINNLEETDDNETSNKDLKNNNLNRFTRQDFPHHLIDDDCRQKKIGIQERKHKLHSYLEVKDKQLKIHSRDFFNHHSLIICLIQLIKNSFIKSSLPNPSSNTSSNPPPTTTTNTNPVHTSSSNSDTGTNSKSNSNASSSSSSKS